jgi:hypothetical protein
MDKERQSHLEFVTSVKKATKKVNHPSFRRLEELDENLFEIESDKSAITLNLPSQLGFFILNYAKLRMLQFYYDFLDTFIDRADFQLLEMDTDSLYMSLSGNTLDELVKPHLRSTFEAEKHNWLPRTSPPEAARYDKRTPGRFEEEFRGTEMVCLAAKTYVIHDEDTNKTKFSSKGAMKSRVHDPLPLYKDVLTSGVSSSATNTGFRKPYGAIFTYIQNRKAFSYEYFKRKVLNDGVSTAVLNI